MEATLKLWEVLLIVISIVSVGYVFHLEHERKNLIDKATSYRDMYIKSEDSVKNVWDYVCVKSNDNGKLTERVSYLKARLSDYESVDGDTNFIRYKGDTYRITDVVIEDHPGQAKTCSVEAHLVSEEE